MTFQPSGDGPELKESVEAWPHPSAQKAPEAESVAIWGAPKWARSSHLEDEYVLHLRRIGKVRPYLDTPIRVEITQIDDVICAAGATSIARQPVRILVGGHILTIAQARKLRRLLDVALAWTG